MGKRPGESHLEYRKRVIDPVSKSFCAAKWLNATIWLGSGSTTSCHHPPAHGIDQKTLKNNPSSLHNTEHKKSQRRLMLRGKRPKECDYCWRIEDMGRDSISDRVFKTVIYKEEDIDRIANMDPNKNVDLKTLEIAFNRNCNFACSYCNASFSTRWARDIKDNGPYQNLTSDGAGAFQQNGDWAEPYKDEEENPYIQAFWQWWPDLEKSLEELRITGGEPLMSKDVWKLFDKLGENPNPQLRFGVNTNLGARPELIEKLIAKAQSIPHFDLYTSCESVGIMAEYIRDGLDYEYYCHNIEQLIERGNLKSLNVMMTINSLSLYGLTNFMEQMLEWKGKYGKFFPAFTVNILRFPSFMSPLALPDHLKTERREHLQKWYTENKTNKLLHAHEREGIERLIDYLEVVDAPHRRTSDKTKLWQDFRSFYEQYDYRRGKRFSECFPKVLVDWYHSIEVPSLPKQALIDGDARKGWDD